MNFLISKKVNHKMFNYLYLNLNKKISKHLFFEWLNFSQNYNFRFLSFNNFSFLTKKRYFFNYLVTTGRIFKNWPLDFFNYSVLEFLKCKRKFQEPFFFSDFGYKLNGNLFLYKNFYLNFNNIIKTHVIFKRNFNNFFLKYGLNEDNFFFIKYRLYGLGFKIKKVVFRNQRFLSFEIGLGHRVVYLLPETIKCFKRKRHFFIFSNKQFILNNISFHFSKFKSLNPYKIRGIKDVKLNMKMKKGKKQGQKK